MDSNNLNMLKELSRLPEYKDTHPNPELYLAVVTNNKAIVESILKQMDGEHIPLCFNHESLLSIALRAGNHDIALLLAQNQPSDLEIPDRAGDVPLMLAVRRNLRLIVKAFIQLGASVDKKDEQSGNTVLMWACYFNYPEIVELILQRDIAELYKSNRKNEIPLMVAIDGGDESLIKFLIIQDNEYKKTNSGKHTPPTIAMKDEEGRTALIRAVSNAKEDSDSNCTIISYLISQGSDANAADNNKRTALNYAEEKGFYKIASNLPKRNTLVDLEAKDYLGRTALARAFANNNIREVYALIKAGSNVDVDIRTEYHEGPNSLTWAVIKNNKELLITLLKAKAKIDNCDQLGRAPLILAAEVNDYEMVSILVQFGANVNYVPLILYKGEAALIKAIKNKNVPMVAVLASAKDADMNVVSADEQRKNALKLAFESNKKAIVDIILDITPVERLFEVLSDGTPNEKEYVKEWLKNTIYNGLSSQSSAFNDKKRGPFMILMSYLDVEPDQEEVPPVVLHSFDTLSFSQNETNRSNDPSKEENESPKGNRPSPKK